MRTACFDIQQLHDSPQYIIRLGVAWLHYWASWSLQWRTLCFLCGRNWILIRNYLKLIFQRTECTVNATSDVLMYDVFRLHSGPKQWSLVSFPAKTNGDLYRKATQLIQLIYRAIILSDNYQLSLPIGSFILLASPTRKTDHARIGKWQTRVVRYSKDPGGSFSDPTISKSTATEHKLSALYRTAADRSWRKLLHSIPCYTS